MSTAPNSALLQVDQVHAHYGKSHVLQGVALQVGDGELVSLLGRNGAGKSTTLKTIAGVIKPTDGQVRFGNEVVSKLATHQVAQRGICLVPEHRGVFKLLTVEENLMLGQRKQSKWQLDDVYQIFPRLKERRTNGGGQLSGGEQQMLAIGRALLNAPRLLMLDEPVEGLAPVIVEEIVAQLKVIKAAGVSILLVEQNAKKALAVADRAYVLETGKISMGGNAKELAEDDRVRKAYLGA